MERAGNHSRLHRNQIADLRFQFLFPPEEYPRFHKWGYFSSEELAREMGGVYPPRRQGPEVGGPTSDTRHAAAFIERDSMSNATVPNEIMFSKGLQLQHILPLGAPLVDNMRVYSRQRDSWQYPNPGRWAMAQERRGSDYQLIEECEVRDIRVGVTPANYAAIDAAWAMQKMDQMFWEKGVGKEMHEFQSDPHMLPAVVLSQEVSLMSYNKLMNAPMSQEKVEFFPATPSMFADSVKEMAVRLLLGNGVTWMLSVSIPAYRFKGRIVVPRQNLQKPLAGFLSSLPPLVGVGLQRSIKDFEEMLKAVTGEAVLIYPRIDIKALAVLAGWGCRVFNTSLLSTVVLGAPINVFVRNGDNRWGYPWDQIAGPLQVHALGLLKLAYVSELALVGVLLADTFPDPEVVLDMTGIPLNDFYTWFSRYVISSLSGVGVSAEAQRAATTRKELLLALRLAVDSNLPHVELDHTKRVWSKLMGDWPSVCFGGARFLHSVRSKFDEQFQLLQLANPGHWNDLTGFFWSPQASIECTYGLPKLPFELTLLPVGSMELGLRVHPVLKDLVLKVSAEQFGGVDMQEFVDGSERSLKHLVMEWGRLHLGESAALLFRLNQHVDLIPTHGELVLPLVRIQQGRGRGNVVSRYPNLQQFLVDEIGRVREEIRGQVERGEGEERVSGWSLPSSLSPPINWCRNILDGQGHSPLVEGQLGFTLERREIMASLGKMREAIWRGCSLLSPYWGQGRIYHYSYF